MARKIVIEGTLTEDTNTGEVVVLRLDEDALTSMPPLRPGANNPPRLTQGLHFRLFSRDRDRAHTDARALAGQRVRVTVQTL